MIKKNEIISEAAIHNIHPHIVEKDYVLGWLLWGIFQHKELTEDWIFKGGTCLRKCYVETYRYSEDLDFTVENRKNFNINFLQRVFTQISSKIFKESGIELPPDYQKFEFYNNRQGGQSCRGRIGYLGPISPRGSSMPRIKIDLTPDEVVVLPPIRTQIFHPYSDNANFGHLVLTYDFQEAFAEKIRALFERSRPRDLYDVIFLFRNSEMRSATPLLREVLLEKCKYKGIKIPDELALDSLKPNIESQWDNMLARQLPVLPSCNIYWCILPEFLIWLKGEESLPHPTESLSDVGEKIIQNRDLRQQYAKRVRLQIEILRFAASNRLCIELDYHKTTHRLEPYTLSKSIENKVVLHAYDVEGEETKSYDVKKIQSVQVIDQVFSPRFPVDIPPKFSIRTK